MTSKELKIQENYTYNTADETKACARMPFTLCGHQQQ